MKQVSLMRSIRFSLIGIATLFTMESFAQASSASFELSPGKSTVQQVSSHSFVDTRLYRGSTPTTFILITDNPHEARVTITLTTGSGKVYEKVTRKRNLRTVLDFSQVEDDKYTLTVSSRGKKFSKNLVLTTTYAAAKNVQIQ